MPLSADPGIGSELLGYRLEALLGRGGMSVVYRAEDVRLRRKVALKLLAPELAEDEHFRERFLRESELAASLDHPSIIPIYEAGEVDGQLYIAMRYVEGTDLKSLLRVEGRLEARRLLALCTQVADALDAAHERGLVHRDVKPSNVLIATQGGREHCYLADFGLTKRASERSGVTSTGQLLGTPDYVAPEQVQGKQVDGRTDVYALGCLLYECLTGEPPFRRDSEIAVVYAHLIEPPPKPSARRPEFGEGIDGVIETAMAKSPGDRYATCTELVEAARGELGLPDELALPIRRRDRRARIVMALAAGSALVAAALLAFFLTRGGGAPEAALGTLVRIDPGTNRVAQTIRLGDPLSAVAGGETGVWAASVRDGALWRIDPRSLAATRIASVGAPHDVAVYGGRAYAVAEGPKFGSGNLTAYGAADGNLLDGVEVIAYTVAAGVDGVWAAGWLDVKRLSLGVPLGIRATVPIATRFPLDAAHDRAVLDDVALGEGSLWVIGDAQDRRLWQIDPRSRRIVKTIELPFAPAHLALGAGSVWVTEQLDDAVARIDPALGRIVAVIPVGRGAGGIAFGAGSIWATSFLDGTVSRIDPRANRVVATIAVAGEPRDVAVAAGSIWVAGDGS